MNPIEQIDNVLFAFDPKESIPVNDLLKRLEQKGITIDGLRLIEIIEKLIADKYLRIVKEDFPGIHMNVSYYVLTFEGEVFQYYGGFRDDLKRENMNYQFRKTTQILLVFWTALAAIATLGLLVLEFRKAFFL